MKKMHSYDKILKYYQSNDNQNKAHKYLNIHNVIIFGIKIFYFTNTFICVCGCVLEMLFIEKKSKKHYF